eukprot:CAMPEP_0203825728 /NCGR_PEP_ID=MMETSP0115-20131106/54962_1 /ASSEMBLY_ACC=CAM_ASM_000227 /TAXON_ID=33651 /ORGANISM="Bicosoecid sp, Strain ms1" /LENGTH=258 /DNA_ID=CAMNT_0050734773 /DNA_START=17 /DNA_END=789 /DNA_ORIENTATION=-
MARVERSMSAGGSVEGSVDSGAVAGGGSSTACLLGVWQPDSSVQRCPVCSKKFTMIRRKHHCRVCGLVVCDACSKARLVLPPAGATWGGQEVPRTLTRRVVAAGGMHAGAADMAVHDVRDDSVKRVCDRCVADERADAGRRAEAREAARRSASVGDVAAQRRGLDDAAGARMARSTSGGVDVLSGGVATGGARRRAARLSSAPPVPTQAPLTPSDDAFGTGPRLAPADGDSGRRHTDGSMGGIDTRNIGGDASGTGGG